MPDFKGVVMYRVWNDLTDHAAHYNSLLREHGYAVVKASLAEAEGDYLFYTYGHEVAERDVRRWVGEVMQQMDATAYHGFTAPPEPEQPEPLNAHYTEANVLTYMRRVVDADWETNTLGLPKKGIKLDKNGRQAYNIMCRLFKAVREAFIDADGFNDGPQEAEDLWVWAGEVLVEKHIIA
jgi:hypothetical protein